ERAVAELRRVGERDEDGTDVVGGAVDRDAVRERHVARQRARGDVRVAEEAAAPRCREPRGHVRVEADAGGVDEVAPLDVAVADRQRQPRVRVRGAARAAAGNRVDDDRDLTGHVEGLRCRATLSGSPGEAESLALQIFRGAYRIARRRVVMSFTSCSSTTSAAMRATR